jgi:hypothetical protein
MSNYILNNNHPLIPNANEYFFEKKYVSINSEDRDVVKYPNSSEFEIQLPQDYINVSAVRLSTWSFPSNYDVFSAINTNSTMFFRFVKLYNPGEVPIGDPLLEAIFAGLYNNQANTYRVIIERGFYNPIQMAIELTNKFNEAVTTYLINFFTNNPAYNYALPLFTGYDRFRVVYSQVGQKLWFGNTADQFLIDNEKLIIASSIDPELSCGKRALTTYENWGLPFNLGFSRNDALSIKPEPIQTPLAEISINVNIAINPNITLGPSVTPNDPGYYVPRFYYGSAVSPGDEGYWLLPTLPGASVYYLQCPNKINFMGPSYIYMEIAGLNCIDETEPFNVSDFTLHTNQTNGQVNSAFAKIAVAATPIQQYYDREMMPYKWFNPPAERIRRLKIKIRYHNGQLVDFSTFGYSFTLEFSLLNPQTDRNYSIKSAGDLAQRQSFSGGHAPLQPRQGILPPSASSSSSSMSTQLRPYR